MNFIQTGFLLGGLAIAIPIVVHLLSRWQVQRVELGTMRFLQEVMQDGAQKRKIRRWLLLLTRMAAIAALVLLFARPFLPESIRRDGDRMRIILIDRSASMSMPGQGGRLIDDAVTQAMEVAGELGTDAKIRWAWFDSQVEPFEGSLARVTAPRSVVGDTNYLAALSWARDRAAANPDSLCDVVLISDMQASGLASEAQNGALDHTMLQIPKDLSVRIIDVGRPAANNLAIQSALTSSKRILPEDNVVADVTLFNYGTLPMEEIPMTATASNGERQVRLKKSINIPGGQAQELAFDFGKLDSGTWQVTIQLDVEDDLAVDNRRMTAFEVAHPAPVMVIDSGLEEDEQFAASYYLSAALRQTNRSSESNTSSDTESEQNVHGVFAPQVVSLYDESPLALHPNRTALVVVVDSETLTSSDIAKLEQYVESGGKLLVFAGDGASGERSKSTSIWQQSSLAPGEIGRPLRAGAMPFRITSLDTDHSMLRPFSDPQQGDLGRLGFRQILPVSVKADTQVLAEFEQSHPALTAHRAGSGKVVWFLSSADASWGDWPRSPLYLPLVHQMAADLLSLTGEGRIRFRSIGDQRLQRGTGQPGRLANGNVQPRQTNIRKVSGGNLQSHPLVFDRPGFEQSDGSLYVVNPTAKESDPTRIASDQFADHFQITATNPESTELPDTVQGEHKHELWPWVACLAVVLLTAEFTLANRTSA